MIKIEFLSKTKIFLGVSYEMQNHCTEFTENRKMIIYENHIFSIGLFFLNIALIIKGNVVDTD